jgi:hypothetical protein
MLLAFIDTYCPVNGKYFLSVSDYFLLIANLFSTLYFALVAVCTLPEIKV